MTASKTASLDMLALGNAIVDVVAPVEPDFLSRQNLHPGGMRLIDTSTAAQLYAAMPPGTESSGGSAANAAAVAAMLGARAGFLGKVADDQLGQVFAHDIVASGVRFPSAASRTGAPTASCLILVTPDGQRTMNTHLGCAGEFSAEDVLREEIESAAVIFLEGYLFDPPAAQDAFYQAARMARSAGRKVAVSLSDAFCVERHRTAFMDLLRETDILFANEAEICSLYKADHFADAAAAARASLPLAVLTRGSDGSEIFCGDSHIHVDAVATHVVDTTGAGDAYAGGFLAGMARGIALEACGKLGSKAAGIVIAQYGARPPQAALAGM
jgi:fructokinase